MDEISTEIDACANWELEVSLYIRRDREPELEEDPLTFFRGAA